MSLDSSSRAEVSAGGGWLYYLPVDRGLFPARQGMPLDVFYSAPLVVPLLHSSRVLLEEYRFSVFLRRRGI